MTALDDYLAGITGIDVDDTHSHDRRHNPHPGSRVPRTRTGYRWLCPGCGWPVEEGVIVFEILPGYWRCLDCASRESADPGRRHR